MMWQKGDGVRVESVKTWMDRVNKDTQPNTPLTGAANGNASWSVQSSHSLHSGDMIHVRDFMRSIITVLFRLNCKDVCLQPLYCTVLVIAVLFI